MADPRLPSHSLSVPLRNGSLTIAGRDGDTLFELTVGGRTLVGVASFDQAGDALDAMVARRNADRTARLRATVEGRRFKP